MGLGGRPGRGAPVCGSLVAGGGRDRREKSGRVGAISRVLRVIFGFPEMFVIFEKKPLYL